MPGRVDTWPAWPEYTAEKAEKDEQLPDYKKEILATYGEEALRSSWLKVCAELESITDEIREKGSDVIPQINYEELMSMNDEQKDKLRSVGCFVVREVVSNDQATEWFQNLKTFVADNRASIRGWPAATPFVLNLYWSPTQQAIRSHPHHLALQRELNSWWHDSSKSTSPDPLSYADGVRIRPPGIPFYGLGPHIDAGSLCRWVDPAYRKVYESVFSGRPEELDCYDMTKRMHAKQAYFDGKAHSRVFRAFQGWTALTKAGPREGSLLLYPNVKTAIAYVLLRPFFSPPSDEKDILNAEKWTLDVENPWFPGTWRDDSQFASPSSHPHLRLKECMVNIPKVNPGDTVWWHCDMLHAVEVDHSGEGESSVAYVAATPSTPENVEYMKAQRDDFLRGIPPHDFIRGGTDERGFKGYLGEKGILSGEEGKRAFGFGL